MRVIIWLSIFLFLGFVSSAQCPASFSFRTSYCQNAVPDALPSFSIDSPSVSGTWSPSTISTITPGVQTYTFRPDTSSRCFTNTIKSVTVFAISRRTIKDTICNGASYLFNDVYLSASGTYLDTFRNFLGCDSIVTLNLTVRARSSGSYSRTICFATSYLFNGVSLTSTGTYLDTLRNIYGCDSFVTLNLTVRSSSIGSISRNICSNEVYIFNGLTRDTSGIFLDTFTNSTGCDSVVTLNLTVRPTSARTLVASICSNQVYFFNGENRNTTGIFLDTFNNSVGCDSVVTLNLTVRPTSARTIIASICSNEFYLFNGVNRNTTGTYLDTFANSTGCDSVITLNLTVRPTSTRTIIASICSNEFYVFNGVNRNATGTYLDTFTNVTGCDSVVTLRLTVRATSTRTIIANICSNQVYFFNGENRNTTGIFLDTFTNSVGCDSVVTLNLTVRPTSARTIITSICSNEFYLFNGVNRNTAGVFLDTFTNSAGCDSVVTLNLTVRLTSIGAINTSICSNEVYVFNGINRDTTGVFLDTFTNSTGCDSVVTLHLTVLPRSVGTITTGVCEDGTYSFNGMNLGASGTYLDTFRNYVGCDSVVTLNLSVVTTSRAIAGPIDVCENSYWVLYKVNPTANTLTWSVTNGEIIVGQGTPQVYIHWFFGASGIVNLHEEVIGTSCYKDYALNVNFGEPALAPANVALLYPGANTLFTALDYPVMNWGYESVISHIPVYLEVHTQYCTIPTFDPSSNNYWVEVGDGNGCLTKSYYNLPLFLTGILETDLVPSISLFPNPVNNELNVLIENSKQNSYSYTIENLLGEHLLSGSIENGAGNIDVSLLQRSFYFIRIQSKNNLLSTIKFIKN
jgi:N-acetylneuraminic acid mutarotase